MPYIRFKLDLQNDLQRILYVYIYSLQLLEFAKGVLCVLLLCSPHLLSFYVICAINAKKLS